jgi:hypothetical protein
MREKRDQVAGKVAGNIPPKSLGESLQQLENQIGQ